MEFLFDPWPWYVGGPLIAVVMFLLFYYGKKFGVSSNLETICAIGGAGKLVDFFNFDWRKSGWNLMFIVGSVIGGFIAFYFMSPSEAVALNPQTVQDLADVGFANAGSKFLPDEIFSIETMFTVKGMAILLLSGLFVGFGARYAGGCTSGHAITGLSNLEIPSLVAVIGFFIGGLIMTWLLIPLIF
ncbi:MAG: YeeE/YedE family protein [Flavobacteriaceae bacterium]|nr:YeeE/YedE family protein [Bacteroidia bacterium]MBT8289033.1 YeeE/YedE family protein [Bacteroidia bacterium]NNF74677.1 YeeE/YedE family protein [Flavobacteriaceae bacterium]NNK73453.1 YeeE/YedE family protein [Flavobacteriaceae bacterium]